jgi:hypothetical protein
MFSLLRSLLPFLQGLVKIIAHLVGCAATFFSPDYRYSFHTLAAAPALLHASAAHAQRTTCPDLKYRQSNRTATPPPHAACLLSRTPSNALRRLLRGRGRLRNHRRSTELVVKAPQ